MKKTIFILTILLGVALPASASSLYFETDGTPKAYTQTQSLCIPPADAQPFPVVRINSSRSGPADRLMEYLTHFVPCGIDSVMARDLNTKNDQHYATHRHGTSAKEIAARNGKRTNNRRAINGLLARYEAIHYVAPEGPRVLNSRTPRVSETPNTATQKPVVRTEVATPQNRNAAIISAVMQLKASGKELTAANLLPILLPLLRS